VEELIEDLPETLNARYMHRERGNKSYALNEAMDTITDGLVVFFDDDVDVHPNTLVAYAKAVEEQGRGHFFGGTVHVDREQDPPDWVEPSLPDSARGYVASGSREGKYYLGFNWAAYSSDIKRLGGFDARFGPGAPTGATGQETEMQERMRAAGITPSDVPEAIVTHCVPKERCRARWALRRRFRAGISSYHRKEDGARMIRTALKSTCIGGLLILKSVLVGKPASVLFGLTRVWGAAGIVYAYWQDGMPLAESGLASD
jgi:glycosyltransferase involved in cell wall biosynthesis